MRKYGLIGKTLTHSFSKKYFTDKFAGEGISDCVYDLYPLEEISLFPALVQQQGLNGCNVTIPYKKDVIAYLDEISEEVREMQACNCILIKDGKKYGFNTDTTGFEKTFCPRLKRNHQKALILGTGGASSAVAYVLKKHAIDFLYVSRKALDKPEFITYNDVSPGLLQEYNIIINTTPLGTYPNVEDEPPLPYEYLTKQHYLYDLVYNPSETAFLKRGKQCGATTENGGQMLVIQAEESWKIWNKGLK